jgi:AraC-like DNA-binding protein
MDAPAVFAAAGRLLRSGGAIAVITHGRPLWLGQRNRTRAERYLAIDRYALFDVSDRLGFAASSAFSRWFRRRFGISPTAWREATIGSAIPT